MSRVQFGDAVLRRSDDGIVASERFMGGVGEVAQHGEVQVRLAVREELHLERLERIAHVVDVREQRGDHDRGAKRFRHTMFVQVETRQRVRRKQRRDQLIQDRDRDVERREEGEQQQQEHRLPRVGLDQQHYAERRQDDEQTQSADEHRVRVPVHGAFDLFGDGWRVACQLLELTDAVVDQVETHMCPHFRGLTIVRCRGPLCEIDRPLGHRHFAMARAFRDSFHDVAVTIARRECHLRVEAGGVGPQHRLHHALLLDKVPPVASTDVPQACDAVGHHQAGQRHTMRGQRH